MAERRYGFYLFPSLVRRNGVRESGISGSNVGVDEIGFRVTGFLVDPSKPVYRSMLLAVGALTAD